MNYTTFSLQELLARWKLLHGWEPLSPLAALATPQLDSLLALEIGCWYSTLLSTLPPQQLPLDEFAGKALISLSPAGCLTVAVPPQCLRPVSVKLAQWSAPAEIVPQSPELTLRQHNPFTAATAASPVAMEMPDGSIALYPAPVTDAALESLIGVPAPAADTFLLTPPMLAAMADTNLLSNLNKANTL